MSWSLIRDDGRVVSVANRGAGCRTCGAGVEEGPACSACGRANPKLFSYCGFCGHRLPTAGCAPSTPRHRDDVTSVGAGRQEGTWGGKALNAHEAEQTLDEPIRYRQPLPMRASALGRDTDGTMVAPGLQPPRPYQVPRGLVVLVYGGEADADPVDAHVLEFGEVFDVDGPALRSPAVFTALRHGLRLDDRGGLDRVFVEVRGLGRLRTGQRFRLGELELRYEATSGLMPGVGDTSRPWGRIVVVASPAGSRTLPRPRSVHNLTGVGCGLRFVNGRLEVIDDIDLDDGVCRIVGDLTGVYIESLDAGTAVFKEVLPKDVIELGAVALLEDTRIRIEPAEL